jgi:hypothetical protein
VSSSAFEIPTGVREQLGIFDRADVVEPIRARTIDDTAYTVQIVRSYFEKKHGKDITHGRSVAYAYDNQRDPATFCGKPWRHEENRFVYFDVIANVDRDEAIDHVSCVACQVELS